MQVECPSGLRGTIRKLKVREENLLADRKKLRSGAAINEALGGVWQSTDDPGPYALEQGVNPNWNDVLVGDQLYAMIQMRIATYGKDFAFRTQCTNLGCGSPFEWEIDLEKIPVQRLSEKSKVIFQGGNRYEVTLESGPRIWFKLLTSGEAQRGILNARRDSPDRFVTVALRLQILEVEGVGKKRSELEAFIDDLDADLADELRAAFDAAGCGLETTIDIECPTCGAIGEIEIPFAGDRGFFSRRRRPTSQNSS